MDVREHVGTPSHKVFVLQHVGCVWGKVMEFGCKIPSFLQLKFNSNDKESQ